MPAVGSNQGSSSLLAPPTLAIIGPTPEPSPVSPTRRPHHKSSPTVPTRSSLRPPSTPPVIEKSFSSGSSKRKAEEAGVGGDKTPPKEGKEHKTTFAPDPRSDSSGFWHLLSGTRSVILPSKQTCAIVQWLGQPSCQLTLRIAYECPPPARWQSSQCKKYWVVV
ncbi:hypothetical protein NLJ89_g13 [Agrocybe chaxingu]|uniref:Uncharacterized protein n=1 Tax=Agrocybe chaxingu TaxID=84603 RepID=A0A9W8TFI6_9AGAR|nr:hypothetical protein NLJ89_g13 [Agrocybe chaxingu]